MRTIILAAGKGSRLNSDEVDLPKVLREVNNKPLIEYVLHNASFIEKKDTFIVVGYQGDKVIQHLSKEYNYVFQREQLGTGHAVLVTEKDFENYSGNVLVLYGDMPLVSSDTLKEFIIYHENHKSKCTIMTGIFETSPAYGRIIRDENHNLKDIIEERDCTEKEKDIKELNVGLYIFNSKILFEALKEIKNNNSQREYYLTDVPKIILSKGEKVHIYINNKVQELLGVNTLEDLKECESKLKL